MTSDPVLHSGVTVRELRRVRRNHLIMSLACLAALVTQDRAAMNVALVLSAIAWLLVVMEITHEIHLAFATHVRRPDDGTPKPAKGASMK